jgi:hypothetical protein
MTAVSPPPQFPWARQGAGYAPLRRAGSVRRTTSIQSRWPDGSGRDWELVGRARDVLTPIDGGAPVEFCRGGFTIVASPRREIVAITTEPRHARDRELVGIRAGGASREAIGSVMGDIRHTPLFQLLDDFAGASLVAGWIWMHWDPNWPSTIEKMTLVAKNDFKGPRMNICTGFAEGSSALDASLTRAKIGRTRIDVLPLENPADPIGWHAMESPEGPVMRRARRIDLWREGPSIVVDAGFQDSGNMPDGGRAAIHEYRVHAVIEAETMILQSLKAIPLILPFRECPGAAINALRMVGQPIVEFRQRVIETLPGTAGCTHLNDVLRALADVPDLGKHLPGIAAAPQGCP